ASVSLADVAQHGNDEATLGINRNANVDPFDYSAFTRPCVVPGVKRRLCFAGGGDRTHEANGGVLAGCPIANIGLLGYASWHHFRMRCRHSLRHGAAHAPECLGWSRLRQALGSTLDVCARDSAVGTTGVYQIEINVEL